MKFPKRGNFFIWNLTSNAGGSLMTLKPGSSTPEIECSGSYPENIIGLPIAPSLAVIHDTTVFPLATWSLTLTLNGTDQYHVSVDDNHRIVAKPFTEEITDYDRFLSWSHGSYTMFESKRFRNLFMGCNTEGRVKLLLLHDKSHPDTRALFLMHRFVGLTAGDRPRSYSEFI
ncbi:hypothetical protein OS493_018763 [Desmophyllum pertusum]|uniref:Uncharacterized protein n=1 Tax=Desmophyllum pertusum TaxID=174260 RepID=A0A9W9ZF23_9CNID|nr:hypothetical protein OS493_018763 [Desmophyllum pertusum]